MVHHVEAVKQVPTYPFDSTLLTLPYQAIDVTHTSTLPSANHQQNDF